jgi:ABC-type branched-subunit amino acid transport system ATPase component
MPLLEVTDLSRSFGGLAALKGVSFAMEPNRIMAVIGPNGAGKTTLFNVLSGLLRPDTGRVCLDGAAVTGLPPWRIGLLGVSRTFQNLSLFPNMSVLENVMVGRHRHGRRGFLAAALRLPGQRREEQACREGARACLAQVGLEAHAGRSVTALSFGQRRLVELARALATEPRLLLLDEPASGLTTRETEELRQLILRLRSQGLSILLVEHDMSLVMDVADHILVLHHGQPVSSGTPAQVRADPRVVAIYLGGEA